MIMKPAVREHINAWLGPTETLVDIHPQSGGDTCAVWWTTTSTGRNLVVKTPKAGRDSPFQAEREGLNEIRATHTIGAPRVFSQSDEPSYIVLQAIQTQPPTPAFWENAGRKLALLHQTEVGPKYGWHSPNFIGPSKQLNEWDIDWAHFWRTFRLEPQQKWARERGLLDAELETLLDSLLHRMDDWICDERPCLLHGDLWSGNLLCARDETPILIDPAVYLGHREADLAMTTLFGGFPSSFYAAYQEIWPLRPDWEKRLQFYGLYHWLNHLNAFGPSYRSSCRATLRTLLR